MTFSLFSVISDLIASVSLSFFFLIITVALLTAVLAHIESDTLRRVDAIIKASTEINAMIRLTASLNIAIVTQASAVELCAPS